MEQEGPMAITFDIKGDGQIELPSVKGFFSYFELLKYRKPATKYLAPRVHFYIPNYQTTPV